MKNMIIPFNQKHFGLCFRKKSLQNYERFGSQPHYPAPVKFALAHCIEITNSSGSQSKD